MKRLKKIIYPISQKSKFYKVLLNLGNCFRSHYSHMVLKDRGKNSFFFCKIAWLIWQSILLHKDIFSVVLHLFLHKLFSGTKSHAFLLLSSYPLLLCEWIEKIRTADNIFLNPKSLCFKSYTKGDKLITRLHLGLRHLRKYNLNITFEIFDKVVKFDLVRITSSKCVTYYKVSLF